MSTMDERSFTTPNGARLALHWHLATFRSTLDEHDQVAALAAFRQITVLVLGAMSDRLTPIRHTDKIAAESPHATLVHYAGAGHPW